MEYNNLTDSTASKFLGKKAAGSVFYNPELLVAVPRFENRNRYSIDSENLPFEGKDIWHSYEFSALTNSGIPVTKVLKISYDCTSKYIVESKSLKLYLNSFNMDRFGETPDDCLNICKKYITKDLSLKLETDVKAEFLNNDSAKIGLFPEFVDLMFFADVNSLKLEEFKEAPHLLKASNNNSKSVYYLKFDSLRSNCRVTHQPDFGDLFVYYKSSNHIDETSLIKYLVSFRAEYHFHEECCEMIYKRLFDLLNEEDELFVGALYTRRGGIDISPVRWSKNCTYNGFEKLLDLNTFARAGIKQ